MTLAVTHYDLSEKTVWRVVKMHDLAGEELTELTGEHATKDEAVGAFLGDVLEMMKVEKIVSHFEAGVIGAKISELKSRKPK